MNWRPQLLLLCLMTSESRFATVRPSAAAKGLELGTSCIDNGLQRHWWREIVCREFLSGTWYLPPNPTVIIDLVESKSSA